MRIGYFSKIHKKNSAASFLEEHAKKQPDKIAFYFLPKDSLLSGNFDHRILTYGDFNRHVSAFSGGLFAAKVHKGDRVLVFMPISSELYISIAGLQRMGAIPVLLDSLSRQEQLTQILKNSQPKGIIAPGEWLNGFKDILDAFSINFRVSSNNFLAQKAVLFSSLFNFKNKGICPVKKTDTALITYTTGSSGMPKGANRTHSFLAAQHYALKRIFPYKLTDIDLPVFPVFALNNIASGISTVIPAIDISKPSPEDSRVLINQMNACKVNCMTLAPSAFRNLAVYCLKKNILLKGILRVLTGGAPISESDVLRFGKIAPTSKNWILYGSTEVEPIAYIESKEMLSKKISKWKNSTQAGVNVGKVDVYLKYKFINLESGNIKPGINIKNIEVNEGEVGELVVAGEHVCGGYYKNKGAFARTKIKDNRGGIWHRTGDLARVDENGYLWIVGRKHNVIKRGNEYFFPVRPEIILKDLSLVANAAYLSLSLKNKEVVIAAVSPKESNSKFQDKCRKDIFKVFRKEKFPLDEVVFISDIPMDVRHHSKVDYKRLREKIYELLA